MKVAALGPCPDHTAAQGFQGIIRPSLSWAKPADALTKCRAGVVVGRATVVSAGREQVADRRSVVRRGSGHHRLICTVRVGLRGHHQQQDRLPTDPDHLEGNWAGNSVARSLLRSHHAPWTCPDTGALGFNHSRGVASGPVCRPSGTARPSCRVITRPLLGRGTVNSLEAATTQMVTHDVPPTLYASRPRNGRECQIDY